MTSQLLHDFILEGKNAYSSGVCNIYNGQFFHQNSKDLRVIRKKRLYYSRVSEEISKHCLQFNNGQYGRNLKYSMINKVYQSMMMKKIKANPDGPLPSKATMLIPIIASIGGGYVIYHYYNKLSSFLPPLDTSVPDEVTTKK